MGFLDRILHRDEDRVLGSQPKGPSGEWELVPSLSDDFTGSSLDTTKWEPFNKYWKGRAPGWFNPANVVVRDGALELWSREEEPPASLNLPEQYHTFSTSFVRSKARIGYGYVEAVVRTSDSVTSSAFWLVHNGPQTWNELDVFESAQVYGHERRFHSNAHEFRRDGVKLDKAESRPRWTDLDFRLCEKEWVVGLERNAEEVVWYVEGKAVRRETNVGWHDLMWVQFDCETMGNWFGVPEVGDDRLPAVFRVHGVRTWEKKNKECAAVG